MPDQTDNPLYHLVYAIPDCEQICDLRLRHVTQVKKRLKEKETFYQREYGNQALNNVWTYLES